jgi:membrane fusion protein (multidrug efflux system)
MNRSRKPVFLAVAATCIVVGIAACQKAPETKDAVAKKNADSTVVRVVTVEVTERPFDVWGSFSADLRGIEDANLIAPYQGGRVGWVRKVGSRVKKGDALCDIDNERYSIALEVADAQIALARGDLERARTNVQNGSIGKAALDAANLAFQNARMLQGTARRALEDCRCLAPFDGVVVSSSIEKYQSVNPSTPTVRLSRLDRLEAQIAIPEKEAFAYSEGMRTLFTLLQQPDTVFEGRLSSIDRSVDQRSRTVAARVEIVNRSQMLKPGMVGRARILRAKLDKAIVIPSSALLHLENGLAVMVAENGVARQRMIDEGASIPDSTLVNSGLRQGDRLIVTGAFQVSDGTKISYEGYGALPVERLPHQLRKTDHVEN